MLNLYYFLSHECVVFLFVFVPSGFFAYPFRFLKVSFQLDRIIEEALYDTFYLRLIANALKKSCECGY